MDKELLFQFARVKFQEAEFTAAEIDLHIQSLRERYNDMSPDEIEADVKRRGGPTRLVNSMIEKRNALLLEDEEYRKFADCGEVPAEVTDSAAAEVLEQESPAEKAQQAQSETYDTQENTENLQMTTSQGEGGATESDLFADWFLADTEKAEPPSQKPSTDVARAVSTPISAEDAVPMPQPVHTSDKPHPPVKEMDLSRTRVVSMPTSEQIPMRLNPRAAQGSRPDSPVGSEQYRREQSAIWGASSVTDSDRRSGRQMSADHPNERNPLAKKRGLQQAVSRKQSKHEETEYEDHGNVTWLQRKTYWGEGSVEGVRRFRLIFWLSLPFVVALLLVYAAVAVGLIAGMALLVAGAVVALVAWVAAGALVALVGIIYGVSQIFLVMPIGLFELGIGVTMIGVTMFVGILLYNFAIRLLPYLIRKFIALQGKLKLFGIDLYYYVKGECYRR